MGLPDTLTFGTYTLEEITAPDSHLLNTDLFKLVVDSDGNYDLRKSDGTGISKNSKNEVEIVNLWNKTNTKLTITKLDKKTDVPIEGVGFELFYIDNSNMKVTVDAGFTDSSGILTFGGLEPYREYCLSESDGTALYGYDIGNTTVSSDGTSIVSIDNFKTVFEKAEEQSITVYNHRVETDVEFIKVNNFGRTLSGAEFRLTDGITGDEYTEVSGSDGIVRFSGLAFGNYILEEITVPENYLNPSNVYTVIINKDESVLIEDSNGDTIAPSSTDGFVRIINIWDKANAKLTITKLDEKTTAPIGGVGFELFYTDENNINITVDTGITDSSGILTFYDLEPYREYQLKESDGTALYGYDVAKTTVSSDGISIVSIANFKIEFENAEEQRVTVYNRRVETNIEFVKENNFGRTLKGVYFELTDEITKSVFSAVSDENGVFAFNRLAFGNYTLVETSTPLNHVPISVSFNVVINKDKSVTVTDSNGKVLSSDSFEPVVILNEWDIKQDYIIIKKFDDSTGLPIKDVVFELYKKENGIDELLAFGNTDSDGILTFYNLEPYRDYWIKETSPDGYKQYVKVISLDGSETFVSNDIFYHFTFMESVHKEIAIYNYRNTADIEFIKVNEKDNTLSGAEFKLKGLDFTYVKTETSGMDGKVLFNNVPFGRYELTEIKEPDGYVLNTEIYSVIVYKNGSYILESEKGQLLDGKIINNSIPPVTTSPDNENPPETVSPPYITPLPNKSNPDKPDNPDDANNSLTPNDPGDPDNPNNPSGPDDPNNSYYLNEAVYTKSPDVPVNPGEPKSINIGTNSENPFTNVTLPVKSILLIVFVCLLLKIPSVIKKMRKK